MKSISINSGGGKDVTMEIAPIFKLQTRGQVARGKHIQRLRDNRNRGKT
jgi:hypothetical protein